MLSVNGMCCDTRSFVKQFVLCHGPLRTATLSSIGCQTASVRSATTATRSSPLSDVATTADSVVRSSAAAAATRRSLGNSWATQVGGAPTVTQLRINAFNLKR